MRKGSKRRWGSSQQMTDDLPRRTWMVRSWLVHHVDNYRYSEIIKWLDFHFKTSNYLLARVDTGSKEDLTQVLMDHI